MIKGSRKTTADFDVKRYHLRSGDVGRRKKEEGKRTGEKKKERARE